MASILLLEKPFFTSPVLKSALKLFSRGIALCTIVRVDFGMGLLSKKKSGPVLHGANCRYLYGSTIVRLHL